MASNENIDYKDDNIDYNDENDDYEMSAHEKYVRRKLEARLDRKRLKEELEDYEGELEDDFEWIDDNENQNKFTK